MSGRPLPGDSNETRGASVTRLPARRPRSLRGIAIGLVAIGLIASIGGAIAFRRQELTDAWSAARRHSPQEAWTAARRLASEGWSAIRRRLPFDAAQPERTVTAPPAKRVAVKTRKSHQKH
jgi:hypothetical protein